MSAPDDHRRSWCWRVADRSPARLVLAWLTASLAMVGCATDPAPGGRTDDVQAWCAAVSAAGAELASHGRLTDETATLLEVLRPADLAGPDLERAMEGPPVMADHADDPEGYFEALDDYERAAARLGARAAERCHVDL